jgi:hypothetical protein
LNFNFYLLAANEGSPEAESAWFSPSGQPRSIVRAMRDFLHRAPKAPGPSLSKTFDHYVLMAGPDIFQWAAVGELAMAERAAVGFSPAEAQLASKVTLIGDEQTISKSVEETLRTSGCVVERVIPQRKSKRVGLRFPLGSGANHG